MSIWMILRYGAKGVGDVETHDEKTKYTEEGREREALG